MADCEAIGELVKAINGVHHVLKWISAALWLMLLFKDMGYRGKNGG